MGANDTDIACLQRLQNWAAKLIFFASKNARPYYPLSQATPLVIPVQQREDFKVLLVVFKCLADSAPVYLTSSLELYKPATDTTR